MRKLRLSARPPDTNGDFLPFRSRYCPPLCRAVEPRRYAFTNREPETVPPASRERPLSHVKPLDDSRQVPAPNPHAANP